jgi:23S rRNA (guanosine2251-2'-O)-methyltransferase
MRYVILHDVRSLYNVGAIFRTADGAGVAKIFLTGYTPAPIDRFGRTVTEINKTSLGASGMVPWEQGDIVDVIARLHADGVSVVAVEQAATSVSLYEYEPPAKVAYIFGNEVLGVPPAVSLLADTILEIPMVGEKESLNVSVTAGVVLFHHAYREIR